MDSQFLRLVSRVRWLGLHPNQAQHRFLPEPVKTLKTPGTHVHVLGLRSYFRPVLATAESASTNDASVFSRFVIPDSKSLPVHSTRSTRSSSGNVLRRSILRCRCGNSGGMSANGMAYSLACQISSCAVYLRILTQRIGPFLISMSPSESPLDV